MPARARTLSRGAVDRKPTALTRVNVVERLPPQAGVPAVMLLEVALRDRRSVDLKRNTWQGRRYFKRWFQAREQFLRNACDFGIFLDFGSLSHLDAIRSRCPARRQIASWQLARAK